MARPGPEPLASAHDHDPVPSRRRPLCRRDRGRADCRLRRHRARLTFTDTEKSKVTEIAIQGGSGDVTVNTAAVTETTVTRVVQHRHPTPVRATGWTGRCLRIDTVLRPPDCTVSYDITAPAGVAVTGGLTSGDIRLHRCQDGRRHADLGDIVVTARPAR
jgi:hypothetical protein